MKKGFNNKLRFFSVCIILLACSQQLIAQQPRPVPAAYTPGVSINFVRTWDMVAPEQDPNALMTRPLKDVKQATQYLDGLGRQLQTVMKQGSLATGSSANDMVSPIEYDGFDREQFKYLPFAANNTGGYSTNDGKFKLNPFQQQATFMTAQYGSQNETFFYNKTNFEASPLNMATDSYAPGNSWVGSESNTDPATRRNVQMKYYLNTATDAVHIWTVTNSSTIGQFGTYETNSTYLAGELYKNITIDEQKKQVIEFKDKEGKVILKKVQLTATSDDGTGSGYPGWLCTYYIYDDLNNMRCVIQPEGVKAILSTWTLTSTLLNEQCFRYEYDQRNRMIMKKVPGAGEVYMVYDSRDRLVMTQDANIRQGIVKWMVTKYDELNRPYETGLWDNNGLDFATHLSSAYSSSSYPPTISGYEQLTLTHYDDYIGLPGGLSATYLNTWNSNFFATDNNNWPYPQMPSQSNDVKGSATWTQTKVLGTSNTYLYSVTIYDEKGRPIQTQSTNITGGTDVTTTQYSWAGQPLVIVQKQDKQGGTYTQNHVVITKMEYDDLGRVLNIKKTVNTTINTNPITTVTKPEQLIVQNEYDQLGQLKKKTLGNNNLEVLNYDYNIRGWMLGLNRDYAKDVNNANYFGFDLGYDKANNNIIGSQTYINPQYNGNIEGIVWKSKGDGEKRKYDFGYDAANRLMKADFTQYTGSIFDQSAGVNFDVKMGDGSDPLLAYDANGNILRMQQWGWKIVGSEQIDDLTYNYQLNSNKLKQVADAFNENSSKLGDFKFDPTYKTTEDYAYDVNGNLITDNNKRIVANQGGNGIRYNHLNLPSYVNIDIKGNITYTYNATGNKIKKEVFENPTTANGNKSISTVTTYLNGFVYESKTTVPAAPDSPDYTDKLLFMGQEEGRIRFKPAVGSAAASFEYDYMLKDHLGNVRMVLTEEQQQDIYPAATMEPSLVGVENGFYTIDQTKIVANSAATGIQNQLYPNNNGIPNNNTSCTGTLCTTDNSQNLYQLNSNTNKTGLGITLKVMAGDKLDIFGKSYYFQNNPGSGYNNTIPIIDLLSGFLGSPGAGAITGIHGGVTPAQINIPANITGINSMINTQTSQNNAYPLKPRAFINCIIFDEQFKAVDYYVSIVGENSLVKDHYSDLQNITIPKNGFVYIYCSNESPVNVFFDNLQVVQTRGPILEETHYYPFGLTMSGISSKAAGGIQNRYKFNSGTELNNDFDISLYETEYRLYDPQIGRFWQVDEIAEANWEWTPYNFGLNNPISFNDPLGLTEEDPKEKSTKDNPKTLKEVVVKAKRPLTFTQKQSLYWRIRTEGISFEKVKDEKLREWMYQWDKTSRFMEKLHAQQKEEELMVLEAASWFIPVGWITKLKYVKHAINLLKSKRGAKAASSVFSYITKKIANQMAARGWTTEAIHGVVNNYFTTRESVNLATGNAATVFYEKGGAHVVKDNVTNEIIQISDKLKTWTPDKNIISPYIPK